MFIYYTIKGNRRIGEQKRRLPDREKCVILSIWENHRAKGGYPSFSEGVIKALQTKERRAITMYVTYQDLLLFCTFIVALVGLCYTIFKGRK